MVFWLVAAIIVALAQAVALTPSSTTSTFDLTVEEGGGLLPPGPAALRHAYLKYGAEPPAALAPAAALVARATVSGTVTATPTEGDSAYLIPVTIGGATYTLDLNTGSSDFSVYAPKLGASGSTVTTTVTIGGVTVTKQAVSLNNDASGTSNTVGFLYSGINFYTNAVSQGVIAAVFTANLKKGAPGTYRLGYINTADYTGSITYATVKTANGFWEISGNGYAVGTTAFVSLAIDAIVDTGTTLLLLPQSVVKAYYSKVTGAKYDATQGGYTFPCTATLPDLTLGVGTYRATVPGSYFNYAPLSSTSSTCFGGLQSDDGIGFSIFGLVFIKSQFVVFKGTTSPTLGLAKKA